MTNTINELIEILAACDDVIADFLNGKVYITFCDFGGFDEDYCETERDLVNENLCSDLINIITNGEGFTLENHRFIVDGITYSLEWDSWNI